MWNDICEDALWHRMYTKGHGEFCIHATKKPLEKNTLGVLWFEVLEGGTISLAGWTFVPASWRSGGCEVCLCDWNGWSGLMVSCFIIRCGPQLTRSRWHTAEFETCDFNIGRLILIFLENGPRAWDYQVVLNDSLLPWFFWSLKFVDSRDPPFHPTLEQATSPWSPWQMWGKRPFWGRWRVAYICSDELSKDMSKKPGLFW